MKQDIYVCLSCNLVFEKDENDEELACPSCGCVDFLEMYSYDDLQQFIQADEVIVRLSRKMQLWFFTNTAQILRDLLSVEREIANKSFVVHYNLNSIITNTEYMLKIINEWRSSAMYKHDKLMVYKGDPGCLVTEKNWKMMTDTLLTTKNDAERLLSIMESCWLGENCDGESFEPSWDSLQENVTSMLVNIIQVYRFFKHGVDIPEKMNV
jgi:hypothetical protein